MAARRAAGAALLLLCAGLDAACTRGKAEEPPPPPQPAARPAPAVDPELAAWRAGRLPPLEGQGTPVPGGEVVVQMYADPPSLNTIVDNDWWGSRITHHLVYQALVGIDAYDDPRYRFQPELAESWTLSEDKLTYTFHLRKDVRFHDGQPFGAKDVIATYEKVLDETTKAAHLRSHLEELESFRAIDEHTVEFVWKKPYFMALDDPFAQVPIQPAHVIAKLTGAEYNQAATNPLNRAPVGTGPFAFVEWKTDQRVVYRRNEDYWGRKAYLDRLVFRIVKDPTVGPLLAEKGELDVVTSTLSEAWVKMEERPALRENFHRSLFHDATYNWIGWNLARPTFQDRRVRLALTMLIDRERFRKSVLHDLVLPTTCHFYYRSAACDPAVVQPPYDPVAAVKLLEEAGWRDTDGDGVRERDGVRFAFSFMISASSVTTERLATLMKESFARAGIEMSIQKVEWAAFSKRLREHEFDACTLAWGAGPRVDPAQVWHSSSTEGGSNFISFSNPEADALIEAGRVEFDEERRDAIFRKLQHLLHEEQPYTWLWVPARRTLIHRRIHGVKANLAFWQFADWWVEPQAEPPAPAQE
ncbi:MAG: peptide-binding protein [Deltaproteobacteria bacterium]|nr:peptide-binding protein [Deltaproteobacteria bacterium]